MKKLNSISSLLVRRKKIEISSFVLLTGLSTKLVRSTRWARVARDFLTGCSPSPIYPRILAARLSSWTSVQQSNSPSSSMIHSQRRAAGTLQSPLTGKRIESTTGTSCADYCIKINGMKDALVWFMFTHSNNSFPYSQTSQVSVHLMWIQNYPIN